MKQKSRRGLLVMSRMAFPPIQRQQPVQLGVAVQIGHNSVEMAMEWLFSHPEDPSASAAPAAAAAENVTGVVQQLKLAPAQVCTCCKIYDPFITQGH